MRAFNDIETGVGCESCGHPADVQLRDGSYWCLSCDVSARNQGYDDTPIVAMREGLSA